MKIPVYEKRWLVDFCGDKTRAFGDDYRLLRFDGIPLCYFDFKKDEYFVMFHFLGDLRNGTLCIGGELDSKRVNYKSPRIEAPIRNELITIHSVIKNTGYKTQTYNKKTLVHGQTAYHLYVLEELTSKQIVQSLIEIYLGE